MNIKPLLEKVVMKRIEIKETTNSGIVLPGHAQEKQQIAEVVAVGPGGIVDGNKVEMVVKVGDKVIFDDNSYTEIKIDGEKYIIVSQLDLLAVIE